MSGERLPRLSAFLTTSGSALLVAVASGLFGIVSTRALGPYERGLLATAVVWTSVVAAVVAVGVPQAISYHVGRATARASVYATTGLALAAAGGAVVTTLGVALALAFAPNDANVPMAILFGAALPLIVAGAGVAAILGTGAYRTWGLLRFANPFLALLALLVIVAVGGRTATVVTLAMAGATGAQAIAVVVVLQKRGLLAWPQGRAARDLLSYGWRQLVSGGTWLLNYKLDQLVLSVAVAPAALGLYAAASSFGELIAPVSASVGSVMLVRAASGGRSGATGSLRLALLFAGLTAAGMAIITALLAGELLELLFGNLFRPATDVLRILLVGTFGLALGAVLADTLRGLGHPLDPAKAELAGAVITAVLLLALVPSEGIRGAAIASAVSYNFVMILMGLLLHNRLKQRAIA